ncbi:PREDICTED: uncharacterized protein LOC105152976 [Acromyrmex echinatior]|uniref:uncharacterized protein LOC105152976 n=1 Tax=Acromyrmex echinatior TaxID=103372 RepID=UPI000580E228|nr:PREDICTED: uncharacterized protein LOC105152976 [Acromyrmex echinatior]
MLDVKTYRCGEQGRLHTTCSNGEACAFLLAGELWRAPTDLEMSSEISRAHLTFPADRHGAVAGQHGVRDNSRWRTRGVFRQVAWRALIPPGSQTYISLFALCDVSQFAFFALVSRVPVRAGGL